MKQAGQAEQEDSTGADGFLRVGQDSTAAAGAAGATDAGGQAAQAQDVQAQGMPGSSPAAGSSTAGGPAAGSPAAAGQNPAEAKKKSELKTRVRTGVVYFLVSTVCVVASKWTTLLLMAVTAGISAYEYCNILRADGKLPNRALTVVAAVCYPVAVFFWDWNGAIAVSLIFLLALLIWYVFWLHARITDVALSFFGATFTGLLLCGIVLIRCQASGIWGGVLVFCVLLSVWANDACAYFFGSRFGKHKLAPKISPKKTWEGLVAGLVASVVIWCVIPFIPGVEMKFWQAALFGLLCGVVGVLGDLTVSRIKRNSGVKDSGTILPGHGGMLDRTDSTFLVSVFAALLLIGTGCI